MRAPRAAGRREIRRSRRRNPRCPKRPGAVASRRTPADRAAPSRPAAASPRPTAACCVRVSPAMRPDQQRRARPRIAFRLEHRDHRRRGREPSLSSRVQSGAIVPRGGQIIAFRSGPSPRHGLRNWGYSMAGNKGTRVAVLLGGRSPEHDVSVITGLQALQAIDQTRFDRVPGLCQSARPMVCRRGARRTPQLSARRAHAGRIDRGHAVARRTRQGAARAEAVGLFGRGLFGRGAPIEFDVALPAFHGLYGEDGQIQGLFETANLPYAGMRTLASAVLYGQGRDQAPAARIGHSAAALCGRVARRRRAALRRSAREAAGEYRFPVHRQAGASRQQHRGRQGRQHRGCPRACCRRSSGSTLWR